MMIAVLCSLLLVVSSVTPRPYEAQDDRAEPRFTVHEKPPELIVNAGPEGVKVQAKPSKLQLIEYPRSNGGYGCYGAGCHGAAGGFEGGHGGWNNGGGWGGHHGGIGGWGGNGGHELEGHHGWGNCYGNEPGCWGSHHDHTTYVPSHTPPVHVGPNAPPIHVGPHVPAVHVGPHVPSIHYGTHAPLYHVGPHVPFVHMPPPVTTVHAGPMGPPVHVSSPPTVYHQPPVVYHQPHIVGHAAYNDGGYHNYGGHGDWGNGGAHGGGYGGSYDGGYEHGCEPHGCEGCEPHGCGDYGKRSVQKRSVAGESESNIIEQTKQKDKRQAPYYGWHPFPASVHVGPHTPPIHIGPHYPPVHIGPHVPAVHIGPHVPYINIPAHVPAIHVRPHVPAVHISPPVPIINAGNHVPAVHVTSPPTVYHRPPIVIHQPHIIHSPNRWGNNEHEYFPGHHEEGNHDFGHENPERAFPGYSADSGNNYGGMQVGQGFNHGFEGEMQPSGYGGGNGYGKRSQIPSDPKEAYGKITLKSLYSLVRPRRQLLGGNSDGGDSVIFVHPSGAQSPVGNTISGDSPLVGLDRGAGLGRGVGGVENSLGSQNNAFVKSGLSGLSSIQHGLSGPQDPGFNGLSNHNLQGLGGLGPNEQSQFGIPDLSAGNVDNNNGLGTGLPDSIGGAMNLPSSQSAHDDSFASENPNMNIGGLQGNSGFGDENGHGSDDGSPMNFQRSLFPSNPFVEVEHYYDVEKNNLDDSTERDVKSTILRDDDDTDDSDYHVRVHKDEIPRPENFGY